jgi:hypothetical protein
LAGGRDSIKWGMIYHIAVVTPKNRKRYANMFHAPTPLAVVPASERVVKNQVSVTPSVGAAGDNDKLTAGRRDRRPIPIAIPGYRG